MIKIVKNVMDDMKQHGKQDLPNECCGYLAAKDGVIVTNYRMQNIDESISAKQKQQWMVQSDIFKTRSFKTKFLYWFF